MKLATDMKSLKTGSLLPIIAAVLLLGALWMAWSGWQVFAANRVQVAAEKARTTSPSNCGRWSTPCCRRPKA